MWYSPLWAEIDLDAIAHNTRELKKKVGDRILLAVVKANAYGHGAVSVARTVLASGAGMLGVARAEEGIQLREEGIDEPILILGYSPVGEAEAIVENRLTPTVSTKEQALALAGFSTQLGITTPVHVKVDTGLGRFGLAPKEVVSFTESLHTLPGLRVEGLYTHFACADETDKTFTRQQFRLFLEVANQLPWVPCRHAANSAAILDLPDTYLEMVRPGISLYGLYPSPEVSHSVELQPALHLKSRIARLLELAPGQSVSYGRTWIAQKPTRAALVTIGYADGLSRFLSNNGSVLIRGKRAPIIGRVCMDQCIVDVSLIPGVELDDEVTIIGRQGDEVITAEEVALRAKTISYEVLCGISARVPRVYLKNGQIVQVKTLTQE